MQIHQKGKHANGPYWVRVRDRVHVREEVIGEWERPAPGVSLGQCHFKVRKRGRPSLPPQHTNNLELDHLDCESWIFDNQMMSRRPETYLCLNIYFFGFGFGDPKKNLKNMIFHPKWREVLKQKHLLSWLRIWWSGTGRGLRGSWIFTAGHFVGHKQAHGPARGTIRNSQPACSHPVFLGLLMREHGSHIRVCSGPVSVPTLSLNTCPVLGQE